jgi:hypothetical protein
MGNDDLINRFKKVAEVKNLESQRAEFLNTEYHIPFFEGLFVAVNKMAIDLKRSGLNISVNFREGPDEPLPEDPNWNWKNCISISAPDVHASIKVFVTEKLNKDNIWEKQYTYLLRCFDYNKQKEEETNINLTVGHDLTARWNDLSSDEVAISIFEWFADIWENRYGI